MGFGIIEHVFAGNQIPFAPRGDNLDVRLQGIKAQFEAYLIIALAGGSV